MSQTKLDLLALVTAAMSPTEEILRAEYQKQLTAQCDLVLTELAVDGWDADKRFGYPSGGNLRRKDYATAKRRYTLCQKYTQSTAKFSRSFNDPDIREPRPDNAERIAKETVEMAHAALEEYCGKLAGKIAKQREVDGCEPQTVSYKGGLDPWGWSYVSVETSGKAQRWETRMIVNVSCLGKVFNQWPTRLS